VELEYEVCIVVVDYNLNIITILVHLLNVRPMRKGAGWYLDIIHVF